MPKARILKGGWSWKGDAMMVGQIINAPSDEWIANRVADGGLVEPVADDPPEVEAAAIAPAETATINAPRSRRKAQ